jgi:hypothetical protein
MFIVADTRLLKREHTRIAQLFAEFEALPERACVGRQALMQEIDELVRRHMEHERGNPDRYALILRLLGEIAKMDCHDVMYVPRVLVLRNLLLLHIQEEAV